MIQSLLVLRLANGSAMQVANKTDEIVKTTVINPVVVELVDEDIPGATLGEPLEAKNNAYAALRWWLQCRGIKAPSSWNKKQLVTRWGQAWHVAVY